MEFWYKNSATSGGKKKNYRLLWKWAYRRVKAGLRDRKGIIKVERLTELKEIFLDPKGEEKDLEVEEFIEAFQHHDALREEGKSRPSRWMLRQFFGDIDVDCSGGVSWDEFTSYMISTVVGTDNDRAKEFLANPPPLDILNEHKDVVRRLVLNEKEGLMLTAGFDGMLKVWDSTGKHIKSINNAKFSVARSGSSGVGFNNALCPISDVVVGSHGTVTYVSGVDKSLHLYDSKTLNLQRRYIGRDRYNDLNISAEFLGGSTAPVETVVLMELNDGIMSMDVATTNEKEHVFLGLSDGRLAAYPIMRHSSVSQVRPSYITSIHDGSIAKLRTLGSDMLVSCGWDKQLCITSMQTGQIVTRLNGGDVSNDGHNKAAFDFCFNRKANVLASVACERDVYLWNPQTESPIIRLQGHNSLLCSVTFNEAQHQLISLSIDNIIKVWDMRNFKVFQSIKHNDRYSRLKHVAFDSTNQFIVGVANVPYTWCVRQSLSHFSTLHQGHSETLVGLGVCEEKNYVITADPHTLMVWDVDSGRRVRVFPVDSDGQQPLAAFTLDSLSKRVGTVSQNGCISIFNFTNGQCVKDITTHIPETPFKMLHLQDGGGMERNFVIISPSEVLVMIEPTGGAVEVTYRRIPSKRGLFSAAHTFDPLSGGNSMPLLLMGTSEGNLLILSPTTGSVLSTMTHPKVKKSHNPNRRQTDSDVLDEIFQGASTKPKMAVESIAHLSQQRLYATVLGGKRIYFWDLKRKNSIVFEYETLMTPSEALLNLVADPTSSYLISGDDAGFVYVRDVRAMPENRPSAVYDRSQIVLKWVFRAHQGTIGRMMCLPHQAKRTFIITHGVDCYTKVYTLSGDLVGHFGQKFEWFFSDRQTWGTDGGEADLGLDKMPQEIGAMMKLDYQLAQGEDPFQSGAPTVMAPPPPPGKSVAFDQGSSPTFFTAVEVPEDDESDNDGTQLNAEEKQHQPDLTSHLGSKPAVPKFLFQKEGPVVQPEDAMIYEKIHTTHLGGKNHISLSNPRKTLTPSLRTTLNSRQALLRSDAAPSNEMIGSATGDTRELLGTKRWNSPTRLSSPTTMEQEALATRFTVHSKSLSEEGKSFQSSFPSDTLASGKLKFEPATAPTGTMEGSLGFGTINPLSQKRGLSRGGDGNFDLPRIRSQTPEVRSTIGGFSRGAIKRSLTPALPGHSREGPQTAGNQGDLRRPEGRLEASRKSTRSKLASLFDEAKDRGMDVSIGPSNHHLTERVVPGELGETQTTAPTQPTRTDDPKFGDPIATSSSVEGEKEHLQPSNLGSFLDMQQSTHPETNESSTKTYRPQNSRLEDSTEERIRLARQQNSRAWTMRAYSLLQVEELPQTMELHRAITTQPGQKRQPVPIANLTQIQRTKPGGWKEVQRRGQLPALRK